MTADERRETILEAAFDEFALRGLDGTSTEDIARRAGISQPYLFRLFGTKKELFLATVERCLRTTLAMFQEAAAGFSGEEALDSIGQAYMASIAADPRLLQGQMQAYAACHDDDVCAVVRTGFGALVDFAERVSGEPPERISAFFAKGMLTNVISSMGLQESDEPWAQRLIAGCKPE